VTTHKRSCQAAADAAFGPTEAAVMCIPDWTPFFNMVCTFARALGDLGDNWLNVALLIVESTVAGQAAVGCAAPTRVGSVWTDVSGVFAARENLRVVGLTPGMYAVTDGRSAAYFALTGGARLRFALENWPFRVETKYGIAAVQYAEGQDVDAAGDETTGMFGCECADSPQGLVLSCASVPYQEHTGDAASTTVHPMRWDRAAAPRGLMCKEVTVQVCCFLCVSGRQRGERESATRRLLTPGDPHRSCPCASRAAASRRRSAARTCRRATRTARRRARARTSRTRRTRRCTCTRGAT